ncbi:sterol desaturase family protein [Leptospira sp. 96542]|nr:sterol desaturase family protein [Leptospira sp. 96542]
MSVSDLVPYLTIFLLATTITTIRYVVFAGIGYGLVWKLWKDKLSHRIIQGKLPDFSKIKHEIYYSLATMVVFGLVGVGIFIGKNHGVFLIYQNIGDKGWVYFLINLAALILCHDAYFYFTHRLMHWKPIFPYVHRVHHKSTNPSPWAAFAFHPYEAVIEAGIVPLYTFFIPTHSLTIVLFLLYMTFLNVLGHMAFELFPKGFLSHFYTNWHNTTTHHNMHHKWFHYNYGLYFNWWDKLFGTNHPNYKQEFDLITRDPIFKKK